MTLDKMIDEAEGYIRHTFLDEPRAASLPPTFVFLTADGERGVIGGFIDMDSGDEKEALSQGAGALMREKGAVAYAFISEAWMKQQDPREPVPKNISHDPKRVEIVFAAASDDKGEQKNKAWRVKRGEAGTVVGLDPMGAAFGGMVGRFVNLLTVGSGRTRNEHLAWAKKRALGYLARGDLGNAMSSMLSDLGKHPETKLKASALPRIGSRAMNYVLMNDHAAMRRWIEEFN